MRIVLTGGGTGGHVFPALAIAEALRQRRPDIDLTFVGTAAGLEGRAVPKAGEKIKLIHAGGIVGKNPFSRLLGIARASLGVLESIALLKKLAPNCVVGTGGFVMAPVLVAARILRVPYHLQEQNSYPGLSTRKFASAAKAVFIAYSEAQRHLPGAETRLTGNPLRESMVATARTPSSRTPSRRPQILVTGGSLGAQSINSAVGEGIDELCSLGSVTWQYGRSGIPEICRSSVERQVAATQLETAAFFDDMPTRLSEADLVICRAGAMTLSEIALFGVPAILIPFPHAAHDHQTTNARAYADAGAAVTIRDSALTSETLLSSVRDVLSDATKYAQMRAAMKQLARPDAAAEIAAHILNP